MICFLADCNFLIDQTENRNHTQFNQRVRIEWLDGYNYYLSLQLNITLKGEKCVVEQEFSVNYDKDKNHLEIKVENKTVWPKEKNYAGNKKVVLIIRSKKIIK